MRLPSPPGGPAPKRVLVAEDDNDLRMLIAMALARDGHEVVQASDGRQILEQFAETVGERPTAPGFDLIITDVRMPGWSGLDVLAVLHHYPVSPPVVLITAFGDDQVHAEARRLGALATLDKPFDLDDLRALVARAITESGSLSPLPTNRGV